MEDNRSEATRKCIMSYMVGMSAAALHAVMNEDLDWEAAFHAWHEVCENGKHILEHPETTQEEKATALENLRNGILGMGKALYELEEYGQVITLLEGNEDDKRIGVLLGLAYFKVADPERPSQYINCLKRAYPLLQAVECDPTLDLDSKYHCFALFRLESLYLNAGDMPQLGISPSVERAYHCVLTASRLPDLPANIQNVIAAELSKFQ